MLQEQSRINEENVEGRNDEVDGNDKGNKEKEGSAKPKVSSSKS